MRRRGILATAKETGALSIDKLFALDTQDAGAICLCYLEAATAAQQQYAVRRLRRKAPAAHLILVLLGEAEGADDAPPLQFAGRAESLRGPVHVVAERIAELVAPNPAPVKLHIAN